MKTFDDAWPTLPIPGEFDAMDALDQLRWRLAIELAYHLGCTHALEQAQAREDALATAERPLNLEGLT